MKDIVDRYLDRVLIYANKPVAEAEIIRQELRDHLCQKVDDLTKTGIPREEAILEALRQHGPPKVIGYGLRGGFPWIDIRAHGTARGVIAIGPRAVGVFACGGVAMGVVAFGGVAVGLFSVGGLALGLLFVCAGLGIGGMVNAGMAIGLVAVGGLAIGVVAQGGFAVGLMVPEPHRGPFLTYYTLQHVPPHSTLQHLLHLDRLLSFDLAMSRLIPLLIPFYLLGLFALIYLQNREYKRVSPGRDWILDH